LRNFINEYTNIFYFISIKSKWDNQQYNYIKDIDSIKPVLFRTGHHGIPFLKDALSVVINMETTELDKLLIGSHYPLNFTISKIGTYYALRGYMKSLFKNIKRILLDI